MISQNFQELQVWYKAHQLVLYVYQLTAKFPKSEEYLIVNQIRRSSASICANIAEGYTKRSKEYLRYLEISRGSLEETKYFLILSKDLGYLLSEEYNLSFQKADEVGKILYCLIRSIKKSTLTTDS